jgi:hypothetical protein
VPPLELGRDSGVGALSSGEEKHPRRVAIEPLVDTEIDLLDRYTVAFRQRELQARKGVVRAPRVRCVRRNVDRLVDDDDIVVFIDDPLLGEAWE